MAISPPNFKKDAVPTPQGWRDPRTNELLVARKISQGEIDEYLGVTPEPVEPTIVEEDEFDVVMDDAPELVTLSDNAHEEDPDWHGGCHETDPEEFENMSKTQLEEVGREHGIELDRRERKATLIEKLKAAIG